MSVTTQISVDTGSTSFSILIPAISLTGATDQETFTTEAVITSHSGPDTVPPTGVHEKYQFIPMKGTASFVFTVFESLTGTLPQAAHTQKG